ncbi:MAG: hypothetical protein ABR502_11705 [Chitinophagaceae bacterium]
MKKSLLSLFLLAICTTVMAQDTTFRVNNTTTDRLPAGNDMNNRVAARDMRGAPDPPALPVLETYVAQEVVSLVNGKYGKNLYSVKQLRVASGDSAFQVRILENDTTRQEWIGADGAIVTNIYRVDTGTMETSTQMDPNMNITSDTTMVRDTAMNITDTTMNDMNMGDTATRRDTMNLNGTSYIKTSNKGIAGTAIFEDLGYSENISFIRRRLGTASGGFA